MALLLKDCPPALQAAIMRQLEKEGRSQPTVAITYAVANYVWQTKTWQVGPECSNLKLVTRLASRLQLQSGKTAHASVKGFPTAVAIQLTRTTQPNQQGESK